MVRPDAAPTAVTKRKAARAMLREPLPPGRPCPLLVAGEPEETATVPHAWLPP